MRRRNSIKVLMVAVAFGMYAPSLLVGQTVTGGDTAGSTPTGTVISEMIGSWKGTFAMAGPPKFVTMQVCPMTGRLWVTCRIQVWSDTLCTSLDYEEFVHIKAADSAGSYIGYCIASNGIGQKGEAVEKNGVWNWVWHWDDGTIEIASMVTSKPGRFTYESRITDKNGFPLPNLEMDMTKTIMQAGK